MCIFFVKPYVYWATGEWQAWTEERESRGGHSSIGAEHLHPFGCHPPAPEGTRLVHKSDANIFRFFGRPSPHPPTHLFKP